MKVVAVLQLIRHYKVSYRVNNRHLNPLPVIDELSHGARLIAATYLSECGDPSIEAPRRKLGSKEAPLSTGRIHKSTPADRGKFWSASDCTPTSTKSSHSHGGCREATGVRHARPDVFGDVLTGAPRECAFLIESRDH